MNKKVFGQLLLTFSFICLVCACSYYTYEKGLDVGRFNGALEICEEINMLLSLNSDYTKYVCIENKTINNEEEFNFNGVDIYVP